MPRVLLDDGFVFDHADAAAREQQRGRRAHDAGTEHRDVHHPSYPPGGLMNPIVYWPHSAMTSTPLVSIVGVNDAMTLTQDALAAEQRTDLLMPMYGMLLVFFFLYCYPIARWTIYLERKYALKS